MAAQRQYRGTAGGHHGGAPVVPPPAHRPPRHAASTHGEGHRPIAEVGPGPRRIERRVVPGEGAGGRRYSPPGRSEDRTECAGGPHTLGPLAGNPAPSPGLSGKLGGRGAGADDRYFEIGDGSALEGLGRELTQSNKQKCETRARRQRRTNKSTASRSRSQQKRHSTMRPYYG